MGKRVSRLHAMAVALLLWGTLKAAGQEIPQEENQHEPPYEAELEQLPEEEQARLENDEALQQREALAGRRLNLNTADEAALYTLGLLSGLQVQQFLAYRQLLGPLISLYELQAVPGFDLPLIRSLLPYVRAGTGLEPAYTLKDYWTKGKHTVLLRYQRPLQEVEENKYNGSVDKVMLRYRYQFSPYMSWGVVMEKDAGEQFFSGAQKQGFDHYGAHLFLRRGNIKALALGDYTVNMGQGLIQWHGLSFGKSGQVMQVKREGEVLRPYASAGEFYFYRGAGITVKDRRSEWTAFLSRRALDAADSSGSLTTGGYHRTAAEAGKRGSMLQYTVGAVYKRWLPHGHAALNVLAHRFSRPFVKGDAPYRLYGADGRNFLNAGVDYAWGWRNLHFFGEAAVDKNRQYAVLQGLLATLSRGVDAAFVYRHETPGYQAFYADALGENAAAGNESGFYTGLQARWGSRWLIAAYADVFRFPWLRYRINAPSEGHDALVMCTWQPDKLTTLTLRYYYKRKASTDTLPANVEQLIRCQMSLPVITKCLQWKCRMQASAAAWLVHQQWEARWEQWRFSAGYTWYETAEKKAVFLAGQGFPGDNSLARYSGSGWGLQVQAQRRIGRAVTLWCRWQLTPGVSSVQVQWRCDL
ncbi:hypothetical protein [Chitinophaga sp.]|uniref:ComEA family DNA-binding protein n=1 Tax=Chitinophaga sp. TaxID=1869181 RepID=UPI0031D1BB3D